MTNSRATAGAKPTLKVMQVVALMLASALLVACSREKIDWKSAEAADTVEAYDHFLDRHPDGELSTQARTRVAQLNEERDWKKAAAADTADGYRQFLAQHKDGKWAGEARIRVENFALDGTATGPMRPAMDAEASGANGSAVVAPAAVAAPAGVASAPVVSAAKPTVATASIGAASAPNHAVATATAVKSSATTPASPPVAPSSQFGIQLGAFRSPQAALSDWKRIQTRFESDLHGLFAKAVPVQQSSGQLFRLQAPVGEEARARAICASLARQSQPCVVVLPQSH